jgi:S1-C subfamily serine protease
MPANPTTITITLADGTRTNATVIGAEPDSDHAVLRFTVPAAKLVAPMPARSRTTLDATPYLGVSLTGAGVVAAVEPGSPAAVASIQQGDEITAIDAQAVSGARAVGSAFAANAVGQDVLVTVNRKGESLRFTVTLAARAA